MLVILMMMMAVSIYYVRGAKGVSMRYSLNCSPTDYLQTARMTTTSTTTPIIIIIIIIIIIMIIVIIIIIIIIIILIIIINNNNKNNTSNTHEHHQQKERRWEATRRATLSTCAYRICRCPLCLILNNLSWLYVLAWT